jgi:hypothetical protein
MLEYAEAQSRARPRAVDVACHVTDVYPQSHHHYRGSVVVSIITMRVCLSIHRHDAWCISFSLSLSLYLSIHLSIHLSIYPCIHPSIHLSIHPSIYLSIYLSISMKRMRRRRSSIGEYKSLIMTADRCRTNSHLQRHADRRPFQHPPHRVGCSSFSNLLIRSTSKNG